MTQTALKIELDQDLVNIIQGESTFAPLLYAGFIDTHKDGEMTCTVQTHNGPSKSRIDRIFYWTKPNMTTETDTSVINIIIII